MDRKLVVLIYSQYSAACKELIENIQKLPYDIVKVTGMSFLQIDSETARAAVLNKSITVVPTLVVQYFNDVTELFEKEMIYKWISAINKTIIDGLQTATNNQQSLPSPVEQPVIQPVPNSTPKDAFASTQSAPKNSMSDVMLKATEMRAARKSPERR